MLIVTRQAPVLPKLFYLKYYICIYLKRGLLDVLLKNSYMNKVDKIIIAEKSSQKVTILVFFRSYYLYKPFIGLYFLKFFKPLVPSLNKLKKRLSI